VNGEPQRRRHLRYASPPLHALVAEPGLLARFRRRPAPVVDFSRHGAGLRLDGNPDPESLLVVSFELRLVDGRVEYRVASVPSRVRAVRPADTGQLPVHVGVEFVPERLSDRQRDALAALEVRIKRL
jgi:hypothetical protein